MDPTTAAEPDPVEVVARLRAAGCVFAEEEARLLLAQAGTHEELESMLTRRVGGLPLEHVLGWAEFHGRRFVVAPGVFVPRRRTELLVDQAVALARPDAVVVDLCCGSGALGAVVAASVDGARLYAADVDPAAVRCAQDNVATVEGTVYEGDLFDPLPAHLRGRVDLLLANVPYVPTDAIALLPGEARLHEARVALDGGPDGLAVLRRVSRAAGRWLAPGGAVLVETSQDQAPRAQAAFAGHGLTTRVVASDEGDATVVVATLPTGSP